MEGTATTSRSKVVRWLLIGLSLAAFGIAMLIFAVMPKTIVLIIPDGYRGDILIVKDDQVDVGVRRAGAYWFEVPDAGVLRVRDIMLFRSYPGTPSSSNNFECRERSGFAIAMPGVESRPSMYIDGPMGKAHIVRLTIQSPVEPRAPRIDLAQLECFYESGVPRDFVAPRVIRKSDYE